MRRNLHAIQPVLYLSILPITSIPHLAFDIVETARVGIVHVLRLHRTTRVERVEADLPTSLPLRHVDLRRPPIHRRQPECRPRAFASRSLETACEDETPTGRHGEVLFRENGAREVVDWDLLPAVGSGLLAGDLLRGEGQGALCGNHCVRWVHSGATIVVSSPWVIVGEVLRERGRRVEDCFRYEGSCRREPGPENYR